MPEKTSSVNFLMLGACVCCNFWATQEIYFSHPPTKDNFAEAKRKLIERHAKTGCRAAMIAIGLTQFTYDKFNVLVKFNRPLSYYLYGK